MDLLALYRALPSPSAVRSAVQCSLVTRPVVRTRKGEFYVNFIATILYRYVQEVLQPLFATSIVHTWFELT